MPSKGLPPAILSGQGLLLSAIELLEQVPEEEIWLAGQRSEQTRRAYKADVAHFVRALRITEREELRRVDRAAIIQWVRVMEGEGARPRTIRRRLSALSSLFAHLVNCRAADANPVREIKRPRVNRRRGETAAFSQAQARQLLDAPEPTTLQGLRDRAMLSIGLQVGARRSEIARLAVGDLYQDSGFWALHFIGKGGEDHSVSINPQTVQRIQAYLVAAGHSEDRDGPLFRPVRANGQASEERRHLHPGQVARIVKRCCRELGLDVCFSAHSMRATFITTALDNGCSLEDVQRDVGHADPTTTKLYDKRGHNPERSASFFASY